MIKLLSNCCCGELIVVSSTQTADILERRDKKGKIFTNISIYYFIFYTLYSVNMHKNEPDLTNYLLQDFF